MPKENRTIKRALDVLELIKNEQKPMTIAQISNFFDMPRSSASDILTTLFLEGYIELADNYQKSYVLGLKAFEIGAGYLHNSDLSPSARPYLEKLMSLSESTAFLAIENKGQLVYLDKVEAPSSVRTSAQLGSRNDMYCTGLGKALLASYPTSRVREIFDKSDIKKLTENTITEYDELIKELEATHERGYALDRGEASPEVFCIAAPIYDVSNHTVAAISIAFLYSKMNNELTEKYTTAVTDSAFQISKKLGYLKQQLYWDKPSVLNPGK